MSQTSLADDLGITFQQVQKYEKGTNRIGAGRLLAIAEVLGVPISYFFPQPGQDGEAAAETTTLDLLNSPGAAELLRDYARITDRSTKKAIAQLTNILARAAQNQTSGRMPN